MPDYSKDPEFKKAVDDGITAALAARDKAAKSKEEPKTMAELIDRISDATTDKVLARLAEGEDEGEGEGGDGGLSSFADKFFGTKKKAG